MQKIIVFTLLIYFTPFTGFAADNDLQKLAKEFFAWRAITQPATSDDINRVERPDGWTPNYSKTAIEISMQKYNNYKTKLFDIPQLNWTRSDSIDFLLMRSAIERINWEINILKLPYKNPDFYVQQTLGILYELLIINSPMTDIRAKNIITRLNSFQRTIKDAKINLTEPVNVFADIALQNLDDPRKRLLECSKALKPLFPKKYLNELDKAISGSAVALEDYIRWINENRDLMTDDFNVGKKNYEYFLKNIALYPYTPEELIFMGNQAWNRSVAFDHYEQIRNRNVPQQQIFENIDRQNTQQRIDEADIRNFLEDNDIVTVPEWLQHYYTIKTPDHIEPFKYMGVVDDLTSETRLDEDAVAYIPDPSPNLSYFRLATAKDPRPIIIHEGIPGHYFQMALSWKNSNPIRRRYIDSGSMEGIAFYVEELLLQYGLFDDRPHTREIIYSFMRLRALRVDIDVNLALGNYSIEKAGAYLASTIPMDLPTAVDEAGFFAMTPGQAISYQIGKLQILDFLADAKIKLGDKFDLRHFHDYLFLNGNIPIALQRWEYLGLTDESNSLWPNCK